MLAPAQEKPSYKRDRLDRFYTDPKLADAFAAQAILMLGNQTIGRFIEPSCGAGSLLRALGRAAKQRSIQVDRCLAVDLDAVIPDSSGLECDQFAFLQRDWLEEAPSHAGQADLILANPPFAKSVPTKRSGKEWRVAVIQDHVKAMHASLAEGGLCGVLAVQGFLGKPRDGWLSQQARPFKIQQLSPRPSFTGDGQVDLREYVICWWERFEGSFHAPKTAFEWLRWK